MKIVMLGNYAPSLVSFRGALIADLVARGNEVIACAPGENEAVAHELKAMGAEYRPVRFDRTGLNPFRDIGLFVQLVNLFLKERPDLVLNYTIKPVIYGTFAAKLAGIEGIYSMLTGLGYVFIGNSFKQKFLRALVTRLYRIAFAGNKKVFFLNPDDIRLFEELKIIGKRAVLIDSEGIDVDRFKDTADRLPHQPEACTFLLIARLLRDKGIHEFVEAARILKSEYPLSVFRIVGPVDSNPSAVTLSELEAWQQEGVVEYLGETRDVRPFISDSSVYVLPSYREGVPRTVLEAMAMGKPVVTTDAPGCRETVINGENGFLVPVKDSEALACAMERFIADPGLVGSMGKRSREMAVEKFDVRKINAVIMKTMGVSSAESADRRARRFEPRFADVIPAGSVGAARIAVHDVQVSHP